MKEKLIELEILINNTGNKRRNNIEKKQKEIVSMICNKLTEKYNTPIGKFEEQKYLHRNPDNSVQLKERTNKKKCIYDYTKDYNKAYDSKTFDYILRLYPPVDISFSCGSYIDIYFIMKGIKENGGHQDNVLGEIGNTSLLINEYSNKKPYFIYLLDGDYFQKSRYYLSLDNRSHQCSCNNLYNILENIILQNLIKE